MKLFNNGLSGSTGIMVGIGAVILAPIVIPAVAAVLKPVAKTAIKGGILVYRKSRQAVAEVGESVEDLVAEAKAEINAHPMEATEA